MVAEAISNILTSSNALYVLALVLIILVLTIVGINKGWFRFKGKGLTIGKAKDDERMVIQRQWDFLKIKVDAFTSALLKEHEDLDEKVTKYIASRAEDVLQAMIVMNHININKAYVKLQQEKVLATIRKRTNNDFIYSEKFEEMVDVFVEELIKDLISIRESIK